MKHPIRSIYVVIDMDMVIECDLINIHMGERGAQFGHTSNYGRSTILDSVSHNPDPDHDTSKN